jgi:hypothetical protein
MHYITNGGIFGLPRSKQALGARVFEFAGGISFDYNGRENLDTKTGENKLTKLQLQTRQSVGLHWTPLFSAPIGYNSAEIGLFLPGVL